MKNIIDNQRIFFHTDKTLNINYRINALKKLKSAIIKYEERINEALKKDLGKSAFEGYMCETGLVLSEISYMLKHMRTYSKERKVRTPLSQFCSKSYIKPSPYGVVLIMSPWNYPFLLTMEPLIDAIAAGNTVILKPSAYSPNTSAIISTLISECFNPEYISVILGGRTENTLLLNQDFDYIFFTGSQSVGKEVMRQASKTLTPVTLELGGKSPCIVEKSANIKLAAKRIVFGKFLNCGQTCVAPDYIYCDKEIKSSLVKELKKQIILQYTKEPLNNSNYGNIISNKHFNRLINLIEYNKVAYGGQYDLNNLKIEPTIIDNVSFNDNIMQEEIFGPLLPIITYDSINEVKHNLNSLPSPLALYIFSTNKNIIKLITSTCSFGGGCINDTVIHLATSEMSFGGVGSSGMGGYHGKAGFDTFSHYKSIVDKKLFIDLPIRYQPYKSFNEKLLHLFLK